MPCSNKRHPIQSSTKNQNTTNPSSQPPNAHTTIKKYKLPTIPMTESDIKRCHDLQKDPRYQEGIWKEQLEVFLKIKRKAELEAFSKYGLTNITDKYLPQKLELAKSL